MNINNRIFTIFVIIAIVFGLFSINGCNNANNKSSDKETTSAFNYKKSSSQADAEQKNNDNSIQNYKVTFIELGSVRCIPCQKMQPIMKSLEKRYGEQIEVIFYDVWKPKDRDKAKEYKINLIPTQVFLDEKGVEFYRHVGFYPENKIDSLLQAHGLKPVK